MVTSLNHQDQEQIDQLRQFWARYGHVISGLVLTIVLGFSAYQVWLWWKRDQSIQAAHMYTEFTKIQKSADISKTELVFHDLRTRYPKTIFSQQAALIFADMQHKNGQTQDAEKTLKWLAESASEVGYQAIASIRLAAILIADNRYEEARKWLDNARGHGFDALLDDRLGDIYALQKNPKQAAVAYQAAWKALDPDVNYRNQIEAKLIALGIDPNASVKSSSGS